METNNTTEFAFSIDAVKYFIGIKADGSKVSIKIDKKGTIEQQGITATGAPINSVRPFKAHRFNHYKGDIAKYIVDQCNLSQPALPATGAITKQYRSQYEKSQFGQAIADLRLQAADDADGTIDEIASMRSQNTSMNRVLSTLQRELMNPKKLKATTTKAPKVVLSDEQKKEAAKLAKEAAKSARLNYLNSVTIAVGEGGKLTLTA